MKKYPSIEQYRNIIRKVRTNHDFQGNVDKEPVYEHLSPYPTLKFRGTIKLHGTNAAIVLYKEKGIKYQSRERELSLEKDNAGFMLAMSSKDTSSLFEGLEFTDYIAVYGEWCGGNIQSGVALTQLPKMFVIFGYDIDGKWVDIDRDITDLGIFNISRFKTYEIDIDFNEPEAIQNQLIEWTEEVENECPFAKSFGVSGIGEGIVFTSVLYPELKFKSKGEKHSSSKVKVLNSVNTEELANIQEFVEYAVTESRLEQGLNYLKENNLDMSQKSTGQFLSWIFNDIIKEESDTIVSNQIDLKKANGLIASKARMWFFKHF